MKKLLFILFVCSSFGALSQTYRNNWIDYSQSYYKFKIGQDGIYRIPYTALQAAGLGSVPAEQFQLWRNGEEQTIYLSVATGQLGASDYIEFFGLKNDGKPDKKLYRDPDFQLTDHNSIISDTTSYFLTAHAGTNARFVNAANNVAGNVLPAERYFMNTLGGYPQTQLNPGYSIPVGGVYLYSSSYDQAEGWSSKFIPPNSSESIGFGNMNIYSAGPDATIRFGAAGAAFNSRNVKVTVSNSFYTGVVASEPMPNMNYIRKSVPFSISLLNGNPNWVNFKFENTSSVPTDRMVVSYLEFTYPSTFNFNNNSSFYFELPASAQGNYLEITNFKTGSVAPVLYDYSTGKRYVGDITSTPGKIKFALPPSVALQKFRLISQDPAEITSISQLIKRDFVDYSVASNQGDYIIISNPVLYNSTSGNNYVDEYRQYRSTEKGGNFKTIVVDINEITDQFGYGIDRHPLGIKEFIQFAVSRFSVKPRFVFIIGKGVAYDEYRKSIKSVFANQLNLIPTFGSPASDILLASPYGITTPSVPIGRLSAINAEEVEAYLSKVKQYEEEQQSPNQTIEEKLWMKNVMQIVGGKDSSENAGFRNYMYGYRHILEDTLMGAHVELFSKTSNSAVQLISTRRIAELFKEGTGLVSYFGHSSANTLEYNLSDPASYDNQNKYPVFLVSGCIAGNTFVFDSTRIIENNKSISENFVLSPQRGAIAFLASTHYGIPPYLDDYNRSLYNLASGSEYGKSLGIIMQKVIKELDGDDPSLYFFSRADLEEMGLQGDPAIRMFMYPKPDYVVETSQIQVNPSFISVSQEKFLLKVAAYNIGKAVSDSIYLVIRRIYPSGSSEVILKNKIPGIRYSDSLSLNIPIIPTRDKGLNKIVVSIDDENAVDEMSESNNIATKEFYIFEDEAKPIYPQNYSIIGTSTQMLYASTANPNATSKEYRFEIDTTMMFNSPLKKGGNITASGGIVEFDPGVTFTDSTVYFWRVSLVPSTGEASDYRWLNSSFQYINGQSGYSQVQYYQHLNSDTVNIHLDSTRNWQYANVENIIFSNMGVYPTAATLGTEMQVNINGTEIAAAFCSMNYNLMFNVIDPLTLTPWYNTYGTGRFGSFPVCEKRRVTNFEFDKINTSSRRKTVMDFMDSIPDNYIVVVRWVGVSDSTKYVYADKWAADTAIFGAGNSLYHKLVAQGFAELDSFNKPRTFIFMYQKNNPTFRPEYIFSKGIYDKIELQKNFLTNDSVGIITSPKFGPTSQWNYLHWKGKDLSGDPGNDKAELRLLGSGYDANIEPTLLMTLDKSQTDVDLSSINSKQYPYLQLQLRNADSITFTPFQLKYWMLDAKQVPEGAVAPKLYYTAKDTLDQGEIFNFGIAFKNISVTAFDSMKINMVILDSRNVTHTIQLPRAKPLISGDTIKVNYQFDTKDYPGLNTLFIEFNPDNDQPEVQHSNNFLYHNFYVKPDYFNPLLDVTFDGIHILNRDIVSSRPHILIKLKDESKFLKLTDTALIKVQLRYPDGKLKTIPFDNDTLRFTPASGTDNSATIDFIPNLPGEDDEYELIVTGTDVVGNKSPLDYHVTFRVIGKPMISNFLNYPNPFTTSTAFVFTITGYEVPQNFRIQILTVTGKVVREITRQELGPLHIGRNITEFKWDGTDMYGQKLANGVYLYRVLTNLNGKTMDKFTDSGDNTDKYFNKGYGKMYLMR